MVLKMAGCLKSKGKRHNHRNTELSEDPSTSNNALIMTWAF